MRPKITSEPIKLEIFSISFLLGLIIFFWARYFKILAAFIDPPPKPALFGIFLLILITSLIKNSTKKIEDEIFTINENIRLLKAELGDVLLEYNYLSSPEKLLQHQSNYFENDLIKMNITKIKKITLSDKDLIITDFIKTKK